MHNKLWQRVRSHGPVYAALGIVCACAWSPHTARNDVMPSVSPEAQANLVPLSAQALEQTSQVSAPLPAPGDAAALAAATPVAAVQPIAAPSAALPDVAGVSPEPTVLEDARAGAATPDEPAAEQRNHVPLAAHLDSLRAVLPATKLAALSAFDVNRTVTRFEVSGVSRLSQQVIDATLQGFLGAERDDEVLNAARDALQRAHNLQGYRVNVVVGENQQRDGVARLEVRERKLYSMRIAGGMVYDPVLRRNVRADTLMRSEEPPVDLGFSPKLQG